VVSGGLVYYGSPSMVFLEDSVAWEVIFGSGWLNHQVPT